ncbi:MAG: DinB family protein, partial [Vicinamibacterales bacterium]
TRLRMALALPAYVVQPMEQDNLLAIEAPAVDAPTASAAFEALRRMNIGLVAALTPAQRAMKVTHPERGVIDVEDLIVTLAGHGAHHLSQIA